MCATFRTYFYRTLTHLCIDRTRKKHPTSINDISKMPDPSLGPGESLIELSMRQYLEQDQAELPGWDNKPTSRPTTFMMTTKFQGIQVLKLGQRRWLARKLSEVHKLYLAALGLTSLVFTQILSADVFP